MRRSRVMPEPKCVSNLIFISVEANAAQPRYAGAKMKFAFQLTDSRQEGTA